MVRIKLSAQQVGHLIKLLGVDVEVVDADKAEKEPDYEEAIRAVDESRGKILRPDIEADIKETLTTQLAGKFGGDLRTALRRLSNGQLKTSDLKDLKDDEALEKFVAVISGQKDQSLEDIRQQMKELLAESEREKARIISEKDGDYKKLKDQYTERDKDTLYEAALSETPLTGGDKKFLGKAFKNYVRELYGDFYDEATGVIELRDLKNPEKIALKNNVAVQLKDLGPDFAKSFGILKTDTRDEDPNIILGEQGKGKQHQTSIIGGSDRDVDDAIATLQAQLSDV